MMAVMLRALLDKAASLLPPWATPWRAPAPSTATCEDDEPDARGAALDALRAYLANCPIRFPNGRTGSLHPDDIYVSASSDEGGASELHLPSIGFAGGTADDSLPCLGPPELDEESWGIRGPGTALAWIGEHRERLTVEVWTRDDAERRAVIAMLRSAFRPAEDLGSLALPLPKYFGQVARYTLDGHQTIDDADAARNRVRALLFVDLEVAVVQLVGAAKMRPRIRVDVAET